MDTGRLRLRKFDLAAVPPGATIHFIGINKRSGISQFVTDLRHERLVASGVDLSRGVPSEVVRAIWDDRIF